MPQFARHWWRPLFAGCPQQSTGLAYAAVTQDRKQCSISNKRKKWIFGVNQRLKESVTFIVTMKEIDIKTELKDLIDQETNLSLLETVKALFTKGDFDPSIEKEMISRALKSEQDIEEGRVCTIEEAEARLNKGLGL